MKSDFENCIKTGNSMQILDTRSWVFRSLSLDKTGEFLGELEEAKEYKVAQNIEDWAGVIDRFHIPDEKRVEDICKFVESI